MTRHRNTQRQILERRIYKPRKAKGSHQHLKLEEVKKVLPRAREGTWKSP
jgi:hypothetical protein